MRRRKTGVDGEGTGCSIPHLVHFSHFIFAVIVVQFKLLYPPELQIIRFFKLVIYFVSHVLCVT